jgi:FecR-like protein
MHVSELTLCKCVCHSDMAIVKPNKIAVFICTGALLLPATVPAAAPPLSSAKVTEVNNSVGYQAAGTTERGAMTNDVVKGADVLRTGERSLAEIQFEDRTITRLGSKSVFSFDNASRSFYVKQGLALICMPKGSGGGHIVTSAVTAAIEGTTVIALGDGRILFLEGSGIVSTADGRQSKPIHGGQIAFLRNGVLVVSDVLLDPLLNSWIIKSRAQQLPTWLVIQDVNNKQKQDVGSGKLVVTGTGGGNSASPHNVNDPSYRGEGIIGQLLVPGQPGQKEQPLISGP